MMNNNIKLTAKLKAYSKAPFFSDYVRGVNVLENGAIENLDPNKLYARRNGNWEEVFVGDISKVSDRLQSLELDTNSLH